MKNGIMNKRHNHLQGTSNAPDLQDKHKNFVIIAQARSGSTFLREILNLQPEITCHGEIFSRAWINKLIPPPGHPPVPPEKIRELMPVRDADPLRFLSDRIMVFPGQTTGFKIIYEDFMRDEFADIMVDHIHKTGMKVIHLRRLNMLAAFTSRMRMTRFGIRHSDAPQTAEEASVPSCVTVTQGAFNRYIQRQNLFAEKIDAYFPDALQTKYETLREDFPHILACLGIAEEREFVPALRKMAPENLAEVIENYSQVAVHDHPPQPRWV